MNDWFHEMFEDGLGFFILITLILIGGFFWTVRESYLESKAWDLFQQTHNCKVTGRVKGEVLSGVGTGITSNGQVGIISTTTIVPDKTSYLCDDGITYWR